jgi:N-dimethylarginine dimethylaminohydrolase
VNPFSDLFLMSFPRRDWALKGRANYFSQGVAEQPGPRQAMLDWLEVARAIEAAGGKVVVAPPPPLPSGALTGLPYAAEWGHFFRHEGRAAFILPKMTPPHRQPEPTYIAGFIAALGWELFSTEARWEGQGDVLRVDVERIVHTYGVGPSARTEEGAYREVADHLSSKHVQVRYRADPWFHGNTFFGVYRRARTGEPLVVLCEEAVAPESRGPLAEFLAGVPVERISADASRAYATNALQVRDTVLAPSGLDDRIYGLWRELGLTVVKLELPALFRSGGGAAVCLTNRLDGCRPEEIPPHLYFSAQRTQLEALAGSYPRS